MSIIPVNANTYQPATKASSIFSYVPNDIFRLICRYLDPKNVVQLASTSSRLYFLLSDGPLWNSFLHEYFRGSCIKLKSIEKSAAFFKRIKIAKQNMKSELGKCRLGTFHSCQSNPKIAIHGDRLFSVMGDTISVLDLQSRQELQTIQTGQGRIKNISVWDGKLYSCSSQSIKIWDLQSGEELCILLRAGGEASGAIGVYGDMLMLGTSCDYGTSRFLDYTKQIIEIWDLKSGTVQKTLVGHHGAISGFAVHNGQLISSSFDTIIYTWDLESGELAHGFQCSEYGVTKMIVHGDILIYGLSNGMIYIRDLESRKLLQVFYGHADDIFDLVVHDDILISSSRDCTIKIWDLESEELLRTLKGHQNGVKGIEISGEQLISYSDDQTIKIWDFNPSLSPYSKRVIEKNLAILEKMLWAPYHQESIEELAEKLHPDFKKRLWQHCLNIKGSFPNCEVAILRVQTEVCVEALLDAIHDEDYDRISIFLKYLVQINPKNAEIYRLLSEICGKSNVDRWGEQAFHSRPFHNQQRYPATLFEKQEAVLAFKQWLKDCWGQGISFLADLGIVTEEEYSQKLKCSPGHLFDIGICSRDDLEVLGLFKHSFHFENLKDLSPETCDQPKNMAELKLLQDKAFAKKEEVTSLLQALLDAVRLMAIEAEQGALFYETKNIWFAFQSELENYQVILASNGPKTFSSPSYVKIMQEMNQFIDKFHKLECEHRIAILSNYVNQNGSIYKAWNELYHPGPGPRSLAALLMTGNAPKDLFRMGI